MELTDKVIVVTGAGRGIGAAMCRRFADKPGSKIIVSDLDLSAAESVASEINGTAVRCDVSDASDIKTLVQRTLTEFGRIDVFCSNAGITVKGGLTASLDDWQNMWDINVMSRVPCSKNHRPQDVGAGWRVSGPHGIGCRCFDRNWFSSLFSHKTR